MADPGFRDAHEKDFASRFMGVAGTVRSNLISGLGWPPDASSVPDDLIAEEEERIKAAMLGAFFLTFSSAAEEMDYDLDLDYSSSIEDELDSMASEFAEMRAAMFARSVIQTGLSKIDKIIASVDEPAAISSRLPIISEISETVFSPEQAATIGKTEVTRSITGGESFYVKHVNASSGLQIDGFWMHRSAHAGPGRHPCAKICRPLIGRPSIVWPSIHPDNLELWIGPPAHPNCDCHVEWRVLTPNERAIYGV